MAKRLHWDKEARERRVREHGAAPAARETKGDPYPRPAEPPKDMLKRFRSISRVKESASADDTAADVEIDGRRFRAVSLDGPPSARQKALQLAREQGSLEAPGWAKPRKERSKR